MELAQGGDLLKIIEKHKKLRTHVPEEEIWRITYQIVRGLKVLHDMNILHRDIKSANVFLTKDGTVKIGDLNIAKVMESKLSHTQTGTPYYISPEIWRDEPYDCKCDIWSLGCVVYELATLNPPFRGDSMEQLYIRVTSGVFQDIPHYYSKDLMMLIRSLLNVNPNKRPNCDQILNSDFTKRHQVPGGNIRDDMHHHIMGIIQVSDNLNSVGLKLPAPRYGMRRSVTPQGFSMKNNRENVNINGGFQKYPENKLLAGMRNEGRDRRVRRFHTGEKVIESSYRRNNLYGK